MHCACLMYFARARARSPCALESSEGGSIACAFLLNTFRRPICRMIHSSMCMPYQPPNCGPNTDTYTRCYSDTTNLYDVTRPATTTTERAACPAGLLVGRSPDGNSAACYNCTIGGTFKRVTNSQTGQQEDMCSTVVQGCYVCPFGLFLQGLDCQVPGLGLQQGLRTATSVGLAKSPSAYSAWQGPQVNTRRDLPANIEHPLFHDGHSPSPTNSHALLHGKDHRFLGPSKSGSPPRLTPRLGSNTGARPGSGRRVLSSSSSTTGLADAKSLADLTHWFCGRGLRERFESNNTAGYGDCVATLYQEPLEMMGLPTAEAAGFAGVAMDLVVTKRDVYRQVISTDSSSLLQLKSAQDGELVNDPRVSFIGPIVSLFRNGIASFSIAVQPTFDRVSILEGIATLLKQPFVYAEGTDSDRPGAPLISNALQVNLYILYFWANDIICIQTRTHSVSFLSLSLNPPPPAPPPRSLSLFLSLPVSVGPSDNKQPSVSNGIYPLARRKCLACVRSLQKVCTANLLAQSPGARGLHRVPQDRDVHQRREAHLWGLQGCWRD